MFSTEHFLFLFIQIYAPLPGRRPLVSILRVPSWVETMRARFSLAAFSPQDTHVRIGMRRSLDFVVVVKTQPFLRDLGLRLAFPARGEYP